MMVENPLNVSPYLPPARTRLQERLFLQRMQIYYRAIWLRRLDKLIYFKGQQIYSVLDVGCGPGYFLSVLQESYPQFHLVGIDIEHDLLEAAKERTKQIPLFQSSAQDLPFAENSFDLLFCNQVVEHLPEPIHFFQEAQRVLRPQGLLMFSTPNLAGLAARWLGTDWSGIRFDHISLGTPQEWRRMCRQAGFEIVADGTTALTGFELMRRFPFSLLSHIPVSIWGFFPWESGESYMAIATES